MKRLFMCIYVGLCVCMYKIVYMYVYKFATNEQLFYEQLNIKLCKRLSAK